MAVKKKRSVRQAKSKAQDSGLAELIKKYVPGGVSNRALTSGIGTRKGESFSENAIDRGQYPEYAHPEEGNARSAIHRAKTLANRDKYYGTTMERTRAAPKNPKAQDIEKAGSVTVESGASGDKGGGSKTQWNTAKPTPTPIMRPGLTKKQRVGRTVGTAIRGASISASAGTPKKKKTMKVTTAKRR